MFFLNEKIWWLAREKEEIVQLKTASSTLLKMEEEHLSAAAPPTTLVLEKQTYRSTKSKDIQLIIGAVAIDLFLINLKSGLR